MSAQWRMRSYEKLNLVSGEPGEAQCPLNPGWFRVAMHVGHYFPLGYRVTDLKGSKVISQANAEALQVLACEGTPEVSLTVVSTPD